MTSATDRYLIGSAGPRASRCRGNAPRMNFETIYYDPMPPSPTGRPQDSLDRWVREVVDWHFDPATGSPFWLDFARKAGWDPRRDVRSFDDLQRFGEFQDEWLRGGPVQRWVPKGLAGKPIFVFETGGTTGVPK